MEKQVWYNGSWNTVSGSNELSASLTASYAYQYEALTGMAYTRDHKDNGTFGGYYEGARFEHTAQGETGGPTGSFWNE